MKTPETPNTKQAIIIAIQFLSLLPVGQHAAPSKVNIGASLSWYPLVGLLLGGILYLCAMTLSQLFPASLSAALLLALWVMLTGALHLDGLADCADAWLGGLGSKEKTLRLMKDPTSGPIAITTVCLVLLLKYAALELLFATGGISQFLWALVFARGAASLLFVTTPYARDSGLGSAIAEYQQPRQVYCILGLSILLSLPFLGWALIFVLAVLALTFYYLRRLMLKRLEGCTGDTAGASIELLETLCLVTLSACIGMP